MSAQKDGGPAFPLTRSQDASGRSAYVQDSCAVIESTGGMTMRQAYKIAAIQGLLASGMLATKPREMTMGEMCDGIVSSASEFADAMLAEDAAFASRPSHGGKSQ